jgi:mRNA-degrading endonuclease toxin of MazEF toxin-antitoxin module
MYCGIMRRGDVFMYEKKPGELLPVVVLQDSVLNEGLPSVVCAYIEVSKKEDEGLVTEVFLRKAETGLAKDGVCMLHHVETIDRRLMVAKKGELPKEKLKMLYAALDITLGRFRDVE